MDILLLSNPFMNIYLFHLYFFNPIIFSQSCKKYISLDIFPSFICLVYHGNMNLQAIDFAYTDQMKILMIHLVYS
jgi:hypothetical protein